MITNTKVLLIAVPIVLALNGHRHRSFSLHSSDVTTRVIQYNALHLLSTCALFIISVSTLLDWFHMHENLQPLSGFILCPYKYGGRNYRACAMDIVKFEFEPKFDMLLLACFGTWASLREAQVLSPVSLCEDPPPLAALLITYIDALLARSAQPAIYPKAPAHTCLAHGAFFS